MSLIQSPQITAIERLWEFPVNLETFDYNAFQKISSLNELSTTSKIKKKFDEVPKVLQSKTLKVDVFTNFLEENFFESLFSNNWFPPHSGGT